MCWQYDIRYYNTSCANADNRNKITQTTNCVDKLETAIYKMLIKYAIISTKCLSVSYKAKWQHRIEFAAPSTFSVSMNIQALCLRHCKY